MPRNIKDCPSRDIARQKGERFYLPEQPCRNGHLSKRYTNGGGCVECQKQHQAFYKNGSKLVAASDSEIRLSIQTRVYLVVTGEYVKVGIAENPVLRVAAIQNGCPTKVTLMRIWGPMPRLNARRIEQECLIKFFASHVHGEWYQCNADDVGEFIDSLMPPTHDELIDQIRQLKLVS